jgi:hypothetical protein
VYEDLSCVDCIIVESDQCKCLDELIPLALALVVVVICGCAHLSFLQEPPKTEEKESAAATVVVCLMFAASVLLLLVVVVAHAALPATESVGGITVTHPAGAAGSFAWSGSGSKATLFSTSAATGAGVLQVVGGSTASFGETPGCRAPRAWLEAELDVSAVGVPAIADGNWWSISPRMVTIAEIRGPNWKLLASLGIYRNGTALRGALLWGEWSLEHTTFAVPSASGFHRFAVGFDVVVGTAGVWIDGTSALSISVAHVEPYGSRAYCGVHGTGTGLAGQTLGTVGIRTCQFLLPDVDDLYVDAVSGNDANDGLSAATAFKTISQASYVVVPGVTVHIADGLYRESLARPLSGVAGKPITYKASGKKAVVVGSVRGDSLSWSLVGGLWRADVSAVKELFPDTPRFMALYDHSAGTVGKLRIAREPNYRRDTVWKNTEFWGVAEGGASIPTCTPGENGDAYDCDLPTRSPTILTDTRFKEFGNLTGARIIVSDSNSGHYIYTRHVAAHDKNAGTVTIDQPALFDGLASLPSMGLFSQWYLENQL